MNGISDSIDTMRAGTAGEAGLSIRDVARPGAPGSDQILVKVSAAGLNRADLNAAKGAGVASKDSWGKPIGMEWAGEIIAVGPGVDQFSVGDMVACSGTGGYAEYAICDQGRAIRFDPVNLPVEQAATLPLALMTAHNALATAGGMKTGDVVLVHGASSAVGLAAIQIAKILGAKRVIATSTNPARRVHLAELADVVVDPLRPQWWQEVLDATGGKGADVVVDMVTGIGLNDTMRATALLGRIVNVGRLGGTKVELDLDLHSLRRISFVGVTFRSRSIAEIREINRLVKEELWPLVEKGSLRLPVDHSFPLDQAAQAHAVMASNRHFGKVALIP